MNKTKLEQMSWAERIKEFDKAIAESQQLIEAHERKSKPQEKK